MGLWKRLFGGGSGQGVPDWASFMSEAEYAAFAMAVEEDLEARGVPYEMNDGIVRMVPPWSEHTEQFGLRNLAQMCHQAGPEHVGAVVRGHFDSLFAGASDRRATDDLSRNLPEALPHLKLRLYATSAFEGFDADLVSREIAPDLSAVLCFDLPHSVATVGSVALERWGETLDGLWDVALDNVRAEEGVSRQRIDLEGGAELQALVGDSFFTASRLLTLDDALEYTPPLGVLCAVPHRHAVLFHPIVGPEVVVAIDSLIPVAHGMYQEGPGSISPEIYWWRNGHLSLLPSRLAAGRIELHPPDEFVEVVLEGLARPN